jgi:hypothetical protein
MRLVRHIVLILLVFGLQVVPALVHAQDVYWQPFDALASGERALAEGALTDMFGDDPDLWPDWLDPRAVLLPLARGETMLVVREPYRMPCGQYLFTVFGTVSREGTRQQLGPGFCAGSLRVAAVRGRSLPDLLFDEGYQRNPADGPWRRVDQRVRWTGNEWVLAAP